MDHFHLHVSMGALCIFALMFLGVLWLIAYGIGCYTKRAEVKPPFRTTGYVRASAVPTASCDYHWPDHTPAPHTQRGYYGPGPVSSSASPSGPSTLSTMGSSFAGSLAGNLVADALTGHESSNNNNNNNVSDSSNSDPFGGSGVDFSSNASDTSGFSSCDSGSSASFVDSGGGGFDCSF